MSIAVAGCKPVLPSEFPINFPENSGNMIHARAPLKMFENATFQADVPLRSLGFKRYADYVNETCSHVIVTVANFLKDGVADGSRYSRFTKFLSQFKVPLVIFGLGAQSKSHNVDNFQLPDEAIDFIKFIESNAAAISVRGEFTHQLLSRYVGESRAVVTGCPSYYSDPSAFKKLKIELDSPSRGPLSFSGTVLHGDLEKRMLVNAINRRDYWIEPVNKFAYSFYVESTRRNTSAELPWFLKDVVANGDFSHAGLQSYMRQYFKLFRSPTAWIDFISESVTGSYGSRFHVNMASLLAGKPAVWLTHDSRTRELCSTLGLPSVDIEEASSMPVEEIMDSADWGSFFAKVRPNFSRFNEFLSSAGLPEIATPEGL